MTITDPTSTDLGEFEGDDVTDTSIEIANAGGGLHEALKTDPIVLHRGQRVRILLDCEVAYVAYPPADKKNPDAGVRRAHHLSTTGATIVTGKVFEDALTNQAAANQARKDAEKGQSTVESQLADEHAQGDHTALVDGCPDCDTERKAIADESAAEAQE